MALSWLAPNLGAAVFRRRRFADEPCAPGDNARRRIKFVAEEAQITR
jgi:hypothetical protein